MDETFIITKYQRGIINAGLAILILLLTFPSVGHHIIKGIDGGYQWAFNFLYSTQNPILGEIINPFGPLGFLRAPLPIGENLALGIAFQAIVKFFCILCILELSRKTEKWVSWKGLTLGLLAGLIFDIEFAYIALVFGCLLLELKEKKTYFFWIAASLAIFTLFIHAGFAAKNGIVLLSYLVFNYFKDKKLNVFIWRGFSLLGIYLVFALIILKVEHILPFIIQNARFVLGYGEAMSLHPQTSYTALFAATILLLFPLFYKRNKGLVSVLILSAVLAFAVWKQAVSREELFHARILLRFFAMIWILGFALVEKIRPEHVLAGLASLILVFVHIKQFYGESVFNFNYNGLRTINEQVINHGSYKGNLEQKGATFFKTHKLPDSLRQIIGKEPVDIYPNDLSLIPANDLNWRPRKTIHTATFKEWLDLDESMHFDTSNSLLLFHFEGVNRNHPMSNLDHRYLLNDAPHTINSIYQNYQAVYTDSSYSLFRPGRAVSIQREDTLSLSAFTSEWISLDDFSGRIRGKIVISKSLMSKIRSLVYKATPWYMSYKLENDKIYTYRFNPDAADYGMWLSPFLKNPEYNSQQKVKAIRIFNRNESRTSINLEVFHQPLNSDNPRNENQFNEPYYSTADSLLIQSEGFGHGTTFRTDSMKLDSFAYMDIHLECNMPFEMHSLLAIEFSKGDTLRVQEYFNLGERKMMDDVWSAVHVRFNIERLKSQDIDQFKTYIWNPGPVPVKARGFSIYLEGSM